MARGGFAFGGRSEADDYARCVEDDVIAACDDLLTILGSRNSWQPLSASVRGTMLWLALDEGGEGAWARVLEDPSMSPSEALLYASGLTKEELTARWRAWLIKGRPEVYAALGTRSGLAVLWILVFAALAMRSTRWRLG